MNTGGTILLFAGMAAGAYLAGSIPFGFLIGKWRGVDIRRAGSGNIGATNVTRVVGKFWGRLCFLCDFLKGLLPVLAAHLLTARLTWGNAEIPGLLLALTALAATLGHVFPVYLKFHGGKGVSTGAGAAFALNPAATLCAAAVWMAVFFLSRYVSLASLAAALMLPLTAWLLPALAPKRLLSVEILFVLFAVVAFWGHRANIARLLNGSEHRFNSKKNTKN